MERQQSQTSYAECYVFVDHSNLWIEGQKAQSVKDIDHDPRYRVDLGKFLSLITKDRHLSRAFLYGSRPPPNDSVWKAAREKNFDVKVFDRSGSGKEKELDVAMAHDITKTLYKDRKVGVNVTFITVTGDRDLKPPIEDALETGIPVELCGPGKTPWQENTSSWPIATLSFKRTFSIQYNTSSAIQLICPQGVTSGSTQPVLLFFVECPKTRDFVITLPIP